MHQTSHYSKGMDTISHPQKGVGFKEFESVAAKLWHAFLALPGGKGLLLPCNRLLQKCPKVNYFYQNNALLSAIMDMWTILQGSTTQPTCFWELVAEWPDYVGVVDASSYGVGGVTIGKLSPCPPMVFCQQWPPNVTESVISDTNQGGKLTNLDLKLAWLVLLWLMIEHLCTMLREKMVALFSSSIPMVSWVQQMACRSSLIAEQLIRVLTLCINAQWSYPLTTLHIAGDQNSMTDIPSRSFGSKQNGISRQMLTCSPFSISIFRTPGQCPSLPLQ